MSIQATGTFKGKSWDEQPYSEVEGGPKLARAFVTNIFQGDVAGEGTLEYVMMYRVDGSCLYVGAERIVGSVGGRSGSFVLQHSGTYENGTATTRWSVVPGCGSGELTGLRGEGGFAAGHEGTVSYTLDYDFV
jgi:hypothetical protein